MQTTGWQPRSAQSFMITRVLSGFVKLTANVCIYMCIYHVCQTKIQESYNFPATTGEQQQQQQQL